MRAPIVYGLLSIMLGNVLTSFAAAEKIEPSVQPEQKITLVSVDEKKVDVPTAIARLSTTIQNWMEDFPKEKEIPLPLITGRDLSNITDLMELANSLQNVPFAERLKELTASINTLLARSPLPTWVDWLKIIEYLDVEILKAPLANSMIWYIYAHAKDRTVTENIIIGLPISDEFKVLLAKYWYLNFGTNKNYILPYKLPALVTRKDLDFYRARYNYGFSIEELAAFNKLPQIETDSEGAKILNLPGLRINDLTGLDSILDIKSIMILNLSDNQLTTLPQGIFDTLTNLRTLYLAGNPLIEDQKAALIRQLGDKVRLDFGPKFIDYSPKMLQDFMQTIYY